MNLLHIDCSPRPESHSRQLSAAIVRRLLALHPGAHVTRRDLGLEPIPHTEHGYAQVLSSLAALAAGGAAQALQLSEALIQELEAADVVVLGTPMNNFTVPSVLKAWIDQIVRIGRSFGASPTGEKTGWLRDRPVYVGIAAGGVFSGERANQPDFLTPYLSAALGCVGIRTLHFLPLQATAYLDQAQLATAQQALLESIERAEIEAVQ